ncbi:MAG: hypothetical protein GW778_09325 [Alphaproteobacteria bacterium]|nr:hypothetical protein [Alphaproteobacteria bacterium]
MLEIFITLASAITYDLLQIDPETHLAEAVHFFIEDMTKIFFLLTALMLSSAGRRIIRSSLFWKMKRYPSMAFISLAGRCGQTLTAQTHLRCEPLIRK